MTKDEYPQCKTCDHYRSVWMLEVKFCDLRLHGTEIDIKPGEATLDYWAPPSENYGCIHHSDITATEEDECLQAVRQAVRAVKALGKLDNNLDKAIEDLTPNGGQ